MPAEAPNPRVISTEGPQISACPGLIKSRLPQLARAQAFRLWVIESLIRLTLTPVRRREPEKLLFRPLMMQHHDLVITIKRLLLKPFNG